ncbi:MAG TPA: hypothetical protein VK978_02225 [Candidatus Saccharimonadales bacterium]|nr:hypothetical protein [Candidatus Saccharimonadales bacterium]
MNLSINPAIVPATGTAPSRRSSIKRCFVIAMALVALVTGSVGLQAATAPPAQASHYERVTNKWEANGSNTDVLLTVVEGNVTIAGKVLKPGQGYYGQIKSFYVNKCFQISFNGGATWGLRSSGKYYLYDGQTAIIDPCPVI